MQGRHRWRHIAADLKNGVITIGKGSETESAFSCGGRRLRVRRRPPHLHRPSRSRSSSESWPRHDPTENPDMRVTYNATGIAVISFASLLWSCNGRGLDFERRCGWI